MGKHIFRVSLMAFTLVMVSLSCFARNFEFKQMGNKSSGSKSDWWGSNSNRGLFQLKVGSAAEADSKAEIEVRAATVLKNTNTKLTGVNDIAIFKFRPVNVGKALYFGISTGVANYDRGSSHKCWQVAGCIIEIWQEDKVVRHWTNIPGNGGKTSLTGKVRQMRIDEDGYDRTGVDYALFSNATMICPIDQKGSKINLEKLLKEIEEQNRKEEANAKVAPEPKKIVNADDFSISNFCGFVFGASKPDLEERLVKMQRPFRHFDIARPQYGANTERLLSVVLESRKTFQSEEEHESETAGIALLFEKKYGIKFKESGGVFRFDNRHMHIRIRPRIIEVTNLDELAKETARAKERREANKKKPVKPKVSDEGADVL